MGHPQPFADVLEAVEQLSSEEQETLVVIVRQRMAERGRKRVAAEAREAQREFEAGLCRPTTVDELMDEIFS
jgi:hypothetical protein